MMKSLFAILLLASSSLATSTRPLVKDARTNVRYNGIFRSGVEYFLSIPYGQDTGGQNRFKSPRPFLPKHGGTIDATAESPTCPQALGFSSLAPFYLQNVTDISEDCLKLNIARPNGTKAGDNLPVMVFIHGGSFFLGSKDDPVSQAGGLIQQSILNGHPVIQVNINYRLGVFGYAQSEALRNEGSLNAGIKDQRLALEWVKDNIAQFGGDCENITIFGQSSGGLAIGLQILAYGGKKPLPFHRAIAESQALEPGLTGKFTQKAMRKVATNTSCDASPLDSPQTISCLRSLSLTQLNDAQIATHASDASANVGDEWLPVPDADILPAAPSHLISTHQFHPVPFLSLTAQDDANPFIDQNITTASDTQSWFKDYLPSFTPTSLTTLLSLYPITDFTPTPSKPAEFYRSGRILRDIIFICQPILLGRAIQSHPSRKKGDNVYFGIQNQTILDPILGSLGLPGEKVVHTSEFAYIFANFTQYNVSGYPVVVGEGDRALSRRESRSWSSFGTFGRPSLRGKETLQGWRAGFQGAKGIDYFVVGGPREGLHSTRGNVIGDQKIEERCAFLNSEEIVRQLDY